MVWFTSHVYLCVFLWTRHTIKGRRARTFVCFIVLYPYEMNRTFIRHHFFHRNPKMRGVRGHRYLAHKLYVSSHLVDYLLVFRNILLSFACIQAKSIIALWGILRTAWFWMSSRFQKYKNNHTSARENNHNPFSLTYKHKSMWMDGTRIGERISILVVRISILWINVFMTMSYLWFVTCINRVI